MLSTLCYSPGNLDLAVLERLWVGREDLVDEALQRLSTPTPGNEPRALLLVGPPGAGKTHLLWLVHGRLTPKGLTIALLDDEEWGATSFLELLLKILWSLSARDPKNLPTEKIEAIYQEHPKHPETSLPKAKDLLLRSVGDARLLLVCENLAGLLEGLGEEGQRRWRALLEEHPSWTILAASPVAPPIEPKSPFYGFFALRFLAHLGADQALELLTRKAQLDQKTELVELLKTPEGRAKARAAHHLAGGWPRLYMVLSRFLTREALGDLCSPLLEMLDSLTPEYQAKIARLAPLQRKIIALLCQKERPVTIKIVAERCFISHQSAAKQLGELASLGLIQKTPVGREVYCEILEPLLRLCFEVKANRPAYFRSLVTFLGRWFSPQDQGETSGVVHQLLNRQLERIRLLTGPPAPQDALMDYLDVVAQEAAAGLLARTLLESFLPDVVRLMRVLRVTFEAHQRGSLSGLVLTSIAVRLLKEGSLQSSFWEAALPELRDTFEDLLDCRIPLQILTAAHQYLKTKDQTALLALPLEQRMLVLDALQSKKEKEEKG